MALLDANISKPRMGGPSFSLRHRFYRTSWSLTWALLGRWSPVPFHGWRRFLLTMFGADIHRTARVYPSADIWYPRNLTMAEYSCLASGSVCYCMDKIELRPHALVSQGAYLCGGTHDVDAPSFQLISKPIVIGANAWVAAGAFVGPGVIVGDGSVLGARGVSVKNLAPYTIYAGNPARPIRRRKFDGAVRD